MAKRSNNSEKTTATKTPKARKPRVKKTVEPVETIEREAVIELAPTPTPIVPEPTQNEVVPAGAPAQNWFSAQADKFNAMSTYSKVAILCAVLIAVIVLLTAIF